MGAWIEIFTIASLRAANAVAPHVGAWIEIEKDLTDKKAFRQVAPHVGAWIEIYLNPIARWYLSSHPTWVRGLKFRIEVKANSILRRTPRGCVD